MSIIYINQTNQINHIEELIDLFKEKQRKIAYNKIELLNIHSFTQFENTRGRLIYNIKELEYLIQKGIDFCNKLRYSQDYIKDNSIKVKNEWIKKVDHVSEEGSDYKYNQEDKYRSEYESNYNKRQLDFKQNNRNKEINQNSNEESKYKANLIPTIYQITEDFNLNYDYSDYGLFKSGQERKAPKFNSSHPISFKDIKQKDNNETQLNTDKTHNQIEVESKNNINNTNINNTNNTNEDTQYNLNTQTNKEKEQKYICISDLIIQITKNNDLYTSLIKENPLIIEELTNPNITYSQIEEIKSKINNFNNAKERKLDHQNKNNTTSSNYLEKSNTNNIYDMERINEIQLESKSIPTYNNTYVNEQNNSFSGKKNYSSSKDKFYNSSDYSHNYNKHQSHQSKSLSAEKKRFFHYTKKHPEYFDKQYQYGGPSNIISKYPTKVN